MRSEYIAVRRQSRTFHGGCVVREAVGWLLFVVGVLAFLAVYVALWLVTGMLGWW